jgi:deoxycytidylate deaminase
MSNHLINLAYEQALKSTMKRKYGAVLVYRNKVIGMGYNYSTKISNSNGQCIL